MCSLRCSMIVIRRQDRISFHRFRGRPLCRLCGEKGESVNHIVCEREQLAQKGI